MNRNLLIGLAAVVIIIAAALGYIASQPQITTTTPSTTPSPSPQTTPTATQQPPTTTTTTQTPTATPSPTTPTVTTTTITTAPSPTQTPTTTQPPAQKVTVRIWHALNPEEESVFKQIAAMYMQSHPNIQIVFENKAPDLQTAVLAAISTGEKFDLFIWAHDWIGLMVEAGVLKPVDNEVADVLPKFALSMPQYKGHIYGLPFTAETVALICNKKMVADPPKTFSDLLKIMQQYNKPPQSYGIAYVVNPYFISAWIHGAGGYYFDDKTEKQGLTNPMSIAGFVFFKTYIMPYVGPNPTDYNTQVSLFLSGQAPCMVNGPWSIGAVKQKGLDIFVAPLPPVNSTYVPRPYGGLKMFYVTIYASREAIDFMKWATSDPQVAKILVDKLGYVPVLKDVQVQDPIVQGFYEAVKNVYLMPVSPKMQPVWGAVDLVIQNAIVSDQKSIQQAVNDAAKDLCARGLC
ncbi:extracellular solute-binding protein [Pyrobaculum ferrireducens]|uniref:Maltose ABC transporter n=1 Tax=Pyrobaculum ferrireducens TaxID=1104324 RepID=G7VHP8_9CREN|nr:extracellular solute-binding protein [Pyrobaculum ferrireducens]AET32070.1 maltose ABC transporter [Pyrobaculum ferrireducens]